MLDPYFQSWSARNIRSRFDLRERPFPENFFWNVFSFFFFFYSGTIGEKIDVFVLGCELSFH